MRSSLLGKWYISPPRLTPASRMTASTVTAPWPSRRATRSAASIIEVRPEGRPPLRALLISKLYRTYGSASWPRRALRRSPSGGFFTLSGTGKRGKPSRSGMRSGACVAAGREFVHNGGDHRSDHGRFRGRRGRRPSNRTGGSGDDTWRPVRPRRNVGVVPACRVGRRRRPWRAHKAGVEPAAGVARHLSRRAVVARRTWHGSQARFGVARVAASAIRGHRGAESRTRRRAVLLHAGLGGLPRRHRGARRHHDP